MVNSTYKLHYSIVGRYYYSCIHGFYIDPQYGPFLVSSKQNIKGFSADLSKRKESLTHIDLFLDFSLVEHRWAGLSLNIYNSDIASGLVKLYCS